MKQLILALLAIAAMVSGASAAEADRWHGHRGYYGHHYGHRWGHGPYHRRGYWYYRHGHRYHGWR